MLEKTKKFVSNHKKLCIGVCGAVPACVVLYVTYRVGCQHGMDTVQRFLMMTDYEVYEQVDAVFRKHGVR